jgi:hypothetical protein
MTSSEIKLNTYEIYESHNPKKKYDVYVPTSNGKIKLVSFGDSSYSDYTIHKDIKRKEAYLSRHKNDNVTDPTTPGFWSWWLLWNKPTIQESLDDIMDKFKFESTPFVLK